MATMLEEFLDEIDKIIEKEEIIFHDPRIALTSTYGAESYIVRGAKNIVKTKDKKSADALKKKLDAYAASCKTAKDEPYKIAVKVRPAVGSVRVNTTKIVTTRRMTRQEIIKEVNEKYGVLLTENKKKHEKNIKLYLMLPIEEDKDKEIVTREKEFKETVAKINADKEKDIESIKAYCTDPNKDSLVSYYTGSRMWRVSFYNPDTKRKEQITLGDVVILYGNDDIKVVKSENRKKRNDTIRDNAGLIVCGLIIR